MVSRSSCASFSAFAQNDPRTGAGGYCGSLSRVDLARISLARPNCSAAHAVAQARRFARHPQLLLLLDDFVPLCQLLSQNLILFSQRDEFFFDRHALTLLGLMLLGKSPAHLSSYDPV
jgi:hypothetical protein